MIDNHRTPCDRDIRIENFAAELTSAVYTLVLRRGLEQSWLNVELGLWRALTEEVRKWAGEAPPAAPSDNLETWREALLVDLTDSAFSVAVRNGIKGPLLELELCLYAAFRRAIRRRSQDQLVRGQKSGVISQRLERHS
jgi:hypothetical protein